MTKLPADYWHPTPIKACNTLADLRDMVMAQTEKRSPKWRFVLADDLAMQVQPKPSSRHRHSFECRAVVAPMPVQNSVLVKPQKDLTCDWVCIKFDVYARDDDWYVKPTSASRSGKDTSLSYPEIRDRITATFNAGRFDTLTPSMLMGLNCLICGKGLADPVSQARLIGPECYGKCGFNAHHRFADSQRQLECV